MREELEKALAEEFPFMRPGLPLEEQQKRGGIDNLYGAFGLECSGGWYQLIRGLCAEITAAYPGTVPGAVQRTGAGVFGEADPAGT